MHLTAGGGYILKGKRGWRRTSTHTFATTMPQDSNIHTRAGAVQGRGGWVRDIFCDFHCRYSSQQQQDRVRSLPENEPLSPEDEEGEAKPAATWSQHGQEPAGQRQAAFSHRQLKQHLFGNVKSA